MRSACGVPFGVSILPRWHRRDIPKKMYDYNTRKRRLDRERSSHVELRHLLLLTLVFWALITIVRFGRGAWRWH